MKIRTLLAAGAVAAVATATAFAVPYVAGAANGPAHASSVPQTVTHPSSANTPGTANSYANASTVPQIISQASQGNASGTPVTGKIAGVVPARGTSPKRNAAIAGTPAPAKNAAPTTCSEPDCNLVYQGGTVQHTPHVYVIFWGPNWSSDTSTRNYLLNFFTGLGNTSGGDTWSAIVDQYADGTGHPTFGTSLLTASGIDTSTPPTSVTMADLGTEALKAISAFGITDVSDANIVIASQSGTCFAPPDSSDPTYTFAGNCGTPQTTGYCGFHSDVLDSSNAELPFTNLPYQTDAQAECGENFVNSGSAGTDDGFSVVAGHEAMETITDPIITGTTTQLGWIDLNDTYGGEVGDKCAWGGEIWGDSDPYGDVTLATGKFAVQSLWSNAISGCAMSPLTVTTPATQSSTIGKAVSLQITVSTGGAKIPLTYTSTGLPAGLSLNKTTGLISGTPGVTAGTHSTTVKVSYSGGSQSVSFTWKVSAPTAQIKLTGTTTKCIDDASGLTTAGNKIDILTCAAGAEQQIHFASDNELQVAGGCVTGTTVTTLQPCTAASNQRWTRQANGEYVLKSSGLCLTDPSRANGTQLTLAACTGAATQEWTLP